MNHPRKLALLAAVTAALVAGCGSSGHPGTTAKTAGKSGTVTIAYTAPIADQMLASVAQSVGLFKKNGLTVKVEFLQASLALPALVSGKVQFVIVGAPSAEVASLSGTPLKYVGQWENVIDAGIVANGSITSARALDGKTVAISSAGALSDFLVQIADKKYGVQMHELPLGQLPEQLSPTARAPSMLCRGSTRGSCRASPSRSRDRTKLSTSPPIGAIPGSV
jgi:ABC-type nitrate/sulfonate/bicarbonate transport system substrate-binding protein